MQEDAPHSPGKYHEVMDQLIRTMRMHHRIIEKIAPDGGLHRAQHRILMQLARSEKHLSQKELAGRVGVSPALIARMLKQLAAEEYITRAGDETDSRRNNVQISEKGMDIVEATRRTFDAFDAETFAGITDEEISQLARTLQKMQANLTKIEGQQCFDDKDAQGCDLN